MPLHFHRALKILPIQIERPLNSIGKQHFQVKTLDIKVHLKETTRGKVLITIAFSHLFLSVKGIFIPFRTIPISIVHKFPVSYTNSSIKTHSKLDLETLFSFNFY